MELRRWFLGHWFTAVFALIGSLWLATIVAYALGAGAIQVSSAGASATIDLKDKYEHPVFAVREGTGLEIDYNDGKFLHGAILKVEDAPPVVCWICGRNEKNGMVGTVDYRSGDWFFRAPDKPDAPKVNLASLPQITRDVFRTYAYNRKTGERVMTAEGAPPAAQEAALAAKGLKATDAARLTPQAIKDLEPVSMLGENCVIFNAAFLLAALLWLVIGGGALIVLKLTGKKDEAKPGAA